MRSIVYVGLILALYAVLSTPALAQFDTGEQPEQATKTMGKPKKFELHAQVGYSFGALISSYEGQIRLDPGVWYGGAMDFALRRDVLLELSYSYRTSTITQTAGDPWTAGVIDELGNQTTQYVQIGSLKTFRKGKVAPFVGGNLGIGIFSSDVENSSSAVFFTLSGLGGAKIYLNDSFGIRLQGRLYLPIFFGSVGFYCGGGGCGSGVSGSGTIEGELSTGIFVAF